MSKDNLMSAFTNEKEELQKNEKKGKNDEKLKRGKSDIQLSRGESSQKEDLKNVKDWNHAWVAPSQIHLEDNLAVRDIVPGPFISPRLVKVTPFVVNSINEEKKIGRLRQGIPDAWAEYLAANGLGNEIEQKIIKKELSLGYNNLRVTDFVWNELGLPLTQGIPDPWKPVLSDDFFLGDEKADICLCKPRKKIAKKGKYKSTTCEKSCQCVEPSKIAKGKEKHKLKEKISCSCNINEGDFPKSEQHNENTKLKSSQISDNVIQCDVSGKITLLTQQGKTINGIGSLKMNYRAENNDHEEQDEGSNHILPAFGPKVYNHITKTSKIRNMISNFEPKKQLSKLTKIFNNKNNNEVGKDFRDEVKLVCCKCSCPYFKVVKEALVKNTSYQETAINKPNKSYSDSRTQTENKSKRKAHNKILCDISDCKRKNKKKENQSVTKRDKTNSIENFNRVKVNANIKKKKSRDDKILCGCEMQHIGDNSDSGNNADISDLSKSEDLSSGESLPQFVTPLIHMKQLNEKRNERCTRICRANKKQKRIRKRNHFCSPCNRRLARNVQSKDYIKDVTSDLTDDLPNQKGDSGNSKIKELKLEPVSKGPLDNIQNTADKEKSFNYPSNDRSKGKIKPGKKNSVSENNRLSTGMLNSILERKKSPNLGRINEEETIGNDPVVENVSANSNRQLSNGGNNSKSRKCSQEECRKRGGGMTIEVWSSDSDRDKFGIWKSAWCKNKETEEDCYGKRSDEEYSDMELDNGILNKEFSSLLEESLDLISEPIGRRKNTENVQNSEKKSPRSENKCYVKYCYDRNKKYNWES